MEILGGDSAKPSLPSLTALKTTSSVAPFCFHTGHIDGIAAFRPWTSYSPETVSACVLCDLGEVNLTLWTSIFLCKMGITAGSNLGYRERRSAPKTISAWWAHLAPASMSLLYSEDKVEARVALVQNLRGAKNSVIKINRIFIQY